MDPHQAPEQPAPDPAGPPSPERVVDRSVDRAVDNGEHPTPPSATLPHRGPQQPEVANQGAPNRAAPNPARDPSAPSSPL
ncbi:MAG: hypothetical protein ACJ75C_01815, partial [Actinomycetes bacterium]